MAEAPKLNYAMITRLEFYWEIYEKQFLTPLLQSEGFSHLREEIVTELKKEFFTIHQDIQKVFPRAVKTLSDSISGDQLGKQLQVCQWIASFMRLVSFPYVPRALERLIDDNNRQKVIEKVESITHFLSQQKINQAA